MSAPVTVPKIGLTIEEVEVTEWLCQVGDAVREGDPLVVVNADKSDVVIDAPTSGTVLQVAAEVGDVVRIGAVLATIGSSSTPTDHAETTHVGHHDPAPTNEPTAMTRPIQLDLSPPITATASQAGRPAGHRRSASPYARRLARERGISLDAVSGSGPGGRIVARDLASVLAHRPTAAPNVPDAAPVSIVRSFATLSATADAVEMLAVQSVRSRDIELAHIVSWAAGRAVARRHPEWLEDELTLLVHRSSGQVGSARWHPGLSFPAWCDRLEQSTLRTAAVPRLQIVDLGIDGVIPGIMPPAPGISCTITTSSLVWTPRVEEGVLVTRPRLQLTATYDPAQLEPADAGRLLASVAERIAHIGEVLQHLPHSDADDIT